MYVGRYVCMYVGMQVCNVKLTNKNTLQFFYKMNVLVEKCQNQLVNKAVTFDPCTRTIYLKMSRDPNKYI